MNIVNPHAAGIDVGSRSHFIAVGQESNDVKEFGVYTKDHENIVSFLKEHKVETVAMESTGSYWQTLFSVLQDNGFEVLLVSGHQTKNVRGKTDVKDSQWIQKLHSLGLLRGSFLPSEQTAKLRVISRHRSFLVEQSSKITNKTQKSLRLMNLRLDVVISDIMGKSGKAIIKSILNGERDGTKLAQLADSRVKKSKEEIANALQGEWKEELLYELEECFELFEDIQTRIRKADKKMEQLLEEATIESNYKIEVEKLTKKQVKGKNQPRLPLTELSYKYYGVDLFAIESVSMNTVLSLISEIGDGIYKFATAKQFTSFLRLAPNNKISGGKVLSSRLTVVDAPGLEMQAKCQKVLEKY